jgi:hypothetical protein
MAVNHGTVPRGLMATPRSQFHDGRFGRLFRHLKAFAPDDADLIELADTVIEKAIDVERDENRPSNIVDPVQGLSAGFTYLGQFIDHDLTFDPVSQLDRINDPDALRDFRTPRFDLDSVYGGGPDQDVFLYDAQDHKHLLFNDQNSDLQRNVAGTAIIGDPRNDENSIVANLHLAFIKYHNSVVDELKPTDGFDTASQIVRFHYQWLVIHDFLAKVVGEELINEILIPVKDPGTGTVIQWNGNLRFYTPHNRPFMPVEFSVAAYRFGHSMVRFNYALNHLTDAKDTPPPEGKGELSIFDTTTDRDLRGGKPFDPDHRVAWFRFFNFPEITDESLMEKLQPARTIDTQISAGLGHMAPSVGAAPTGPTSLAARNLLRGKALGLPTGQDVACAMGIPDNQIISNSNPDFPFTIGTGYKDDGSVPEISDAEKSRLTGLFGDQTPLWYYILKEAELIQKGQMLGPVGGRIVAEVFIGLLLHDPQSYLVAQPNFQPKAGQFGAPKDGQFGIADLIRQAVGPRINN